MKIIYLRTVPWFNLTAGGSVGHTSGVINSLDKVVELDVVSNDKLFGVKKEIKIVSPLLKFLPVFGEFFFNLGLIRKVQNVKSYDYIYQRHSGESFIGAYLSKKYGVPLILEFNSFEAWKLKNWGKKGSAIFMFANFIYRRILKLPLVSRVEKYTLKNATYIVVVSDVLKTDLIKNGIEANKILVNPNGVDETIYHPNLSAPELKTSVAGNKKNVVGFIGTFGQWHGSLILAEAIGELYKLYPERIEDTQFLLIGEGNQLAEVKNIVTESGCNENVTFTGKVLQSRGPEYLSVCNVLLSPHIPNPDGTEFFGSPTKLFEYMAMGKAIVASNLNQIGEVLEDEATALLIEANNPKLLAESINKLILDEGLQKKLGENARTESLKKYSWDRHVERLLEFIK
ncbi:MAG: glycosyltransferase family 4 protein [Flavobacteriales bacterium]|nr:glycosyltransferase family 4 protein [Flavobacteriales bacterium]